MFGSDLLFYLFWSEKKSFCLGRGSHTSFDDQFDVIPTGPTLLVYCNFASMQENPKHAKHFPHTHKKPPLMH